MKGTTIVTMVAVFLTALLAGGLALVCAINDNPSHESANTSKNLTNFPTENYGQIVPGPAEENTIQYSEFMGRPVLLSLSGKYATLQIFIGDNWPPSEKDSLLTFLTHEVERLTTGKGVALGNTGYVFQLTNGQPIWGPHTSIAQHNSFECLAFAEHVKVEGKLIMASGRTDPVGPNEYYPYKKTS